MTLIDHRFFLLTPGCEDPLKPLTTFLVLPCRGCKVIARASLIEELSSDSGLYEYQLCEDEQSTTHPALFRSSLMRRIASSVLLMSAFSRALSTISRVSFCRTSRSPLASSVCLTLSRHLRDRSIYTLTLDLPLQGSLMHTKVNRSEGD